MNVFAAHRDLWLAVTAALRAPSRAAVDLTLHPNGANLASYLAALKQSIVEADQKAWRRIGKLVRRVCPSLKELAPTPLNSDRSMIRLDWIDDRNQRFGCHQLSDGTLRAIALITTLAQPSHRIPRFLSIDEHPWAACVCGVLTIANSAGRATHTRRQRCFWLRSMRRRPHQDAKRPVLDHAIQSYRDYARQAAASLGPSGMTTRQRRQDNGSREEVTCEDRSTVG